MKLVQKTDKFLQRLKIKEITNNINSKEKKSMNFNEYFDFLDNDDIRI